MKYPKIYRTLVLIIVACILVASFPVYAASSTDSPQSVVVGTDIPLNYNRETHTFKYFYFEGGANGQYEWSNNPPIEREYSLTTVTQSELCELVAQLYRSNGNSTPTYRESYQLYEVEVKRQWGGSGSFARLGNDFVFNVINCDRPGDLWTLGSY